MARPEFSYAPLRLDRRTLDEASVLGARSFYDDPFFVHLSDEPRLRVRGLILYLRNHLAVLGDAATVTGARDEAGTLVGICAWQRPGTYPLSAWRQAREMAGALRALIPRPPSLLTGLRYVTAMERAHLRDEHWYLTLLAVDPMAWRLGIGTALLEPSLDLDRPGGTALLSGDPEGGQPRLLPEVRLRPDGAVDAQPRGTALVHHDPPRPLITSR